MEIKESSLKIQMNVFNKKTAKHILALGFLLVILLFVSFGIISLREVQTVGNLTKMIYEHPLVVSNAALNAGINMTKMHRVMKDVTISNSRDELNKSITSLNKYEKLVYVELDVIRELIIGAAGQNLEKRTRHLFNDWKPIREEVFSLFHSGRRNEAALITQGRGADHVANLERKMLELTHMREKRPTVLCILLNKAKQGLDPKRVKDISKKARPLL